MADEGKSLLGGSKRRIGGSFRGARPSSASAAAPNGLNMIQLEVVSCTKLKAGDKDGTSDAFVTLKMDKAGKEAGKMNKEQRTAVVENTLSPVFNFKTKFRATDPAGVLQLKVQDEDKKLGGKVKTSSFLGQASVPIAPLVEAMQRAAAAGGGGGGAGGGEDDEAGMMEQEVELLNKKGKLETSKQGVNTLGTLKLRWRWYHAHADESSDEDSVAEDDDSEGEDAEDKPAEGKKTDEEVAAEKKEAEEAAAAEAESLNELASIEIKAGDYQVQVHIIEVRDLRPKDANGLSDPIVHVEALGKKQNTGVKKACLSAAFDEVFIFDHPKLEKEQVETGMVTIRVMDADTFSKADLIGGYTFDASYVYAQKGHELHRKWFGLYDLDNPADSRSQGYLKCSIVVIGPGDKQVAHKEEEDVARERKEEAGGDISKLVTMPSNIKRELKYLVVSVFKAEDLPVMDAAGLGGKAGIDAFVEVRLCGVTSAFSFFYLLMTHSILVSLSLTSLLVAVHPPGGVLRQQEAHHRQEEEERQAPRAAPQVQPADLAAVHHAHHVQEHLRLRLGLGPRRLQRQGGDHVRQLLQG